MLCFFNTSRTYSADLSLSSPERVVHLLLRPLLEGVQEVQLGALLAAHHAHPGPFLGLLHAHLPVGPVHRLGVFLGQPWYNEKQ